MKNKLSVEMKLKKKVSVSIEQKNNHRTMVGVGTYTQAIFNRQFRLQILIESITNMQNRFSFYFMSVSDTQKNSLVATEP